MYQIRRFLAAVPVCACLTVASMGAVLDQAPTLQDVNNAMQNSDYALVEDLCREIVADDSSNAQAWFLLGYGLHAQGELDEAMMVHLKATTFPQTAPLAYYNLGCAHALKGNTDQAFTALTKAQGLGIVNPQQYLGDTDLRSLHDDARWGELLKSMRPNLAAASSSSSSSSAQAQSKSDSKADSTNAKEALHFWAGDWDVYSAKTGQLAGHNRLKFRVNKHVIHERWESNGDSYAGESWNHYDPISKAWRQTWLGSGGDVTQFVADTKSDAKGVMFVGKAYDPKNTEGYSLHRMHVRPIGEGRVRQTGSESTDDGASWVIKYDLIYVKKGEAFGLEDLGI